MNNSIAKAVVSVVFSNINGNSFCGVNDYLSKAGEVSDRVIQVGVNRQKRLVKDLAKLNEFKTSKEFESLVEKYGETVSNKAISELITSLEKVLATEEEKAILRAQNDATINRSDAQQDAYYIVQEKGLKIHRVTKDVYIFGYNLPDQKKVKVKGEYKEVKSQAKTKAKNEIKELANIQDRHFRTFKAGNLAEIKVSGVKIPF